MSTPASIAIGRVFPLALILLGAFLFLGDCLGEDLRQQAADDRADLVAEITAVSGDTLRGRIVDQVGDPNLAAWYRGQALVSDQWFDIDQAQDHFANNTDLAEYRQLRERSGFEPENHQRLARWCTKHDLPAQARVHWLVVLQIDPQNSAALKALGLTWHDGFLMTEAEAEQYRLHQRQQEKERRRWQAEIKRLRKQLEQGQPREQLAARQELQAIDEPAAVPAILEAFEEPAAEEEITLSRRIELMSLLGNIGSADAIEALVTIALYAPATPLRYAAIDQLKTKSIEDYVPILLSQMQLPLESSVNIKSIGGRVVSSQSYSQEQADGTISQQQDYQARYVSGWQYLPVQRYTVGKYHAARVIPGGSYTVPINPGHGRGWNGPLSACGGGPSYGGQYLRNIKLPDRHIPAHFDLHPAGVGYLEDPAYLARQEGIVQDMQTQATELQDAVQQHNELIEAQNQRVAEVLQEVTGEQLRAFPKSWWNWWSKYLAAHPGVASSGSRQEWNATLLNQYRRGLARGTWVWTDQGKRHIEAVLPGDFVLSQDPDTGELAWRVVLAISNPVTLDVSQVQVGEEQLFCSPNHVVWATGLGWQRAANLQNGLLLHGAETEPKFTGIEKAYSIDCYDLIVEEFHTFFVGENPILVHDGAPVGPAPAALPGLSPAAVARAARVAGN